MANVAKIACSIDAKLLARVESIRARTGETRSAFITRALAALTEQAAKEARIARYVVAYHEHPETPEEIAAANTSAELALAQLPWDDE